MLVTGEEPGVGSRTGKITQRFQCCFSVSSTQMRCMPVPDGSVRSEPPAAWRSAQPAPVAIISGRTPRTNAMEVMRMGRNLVRTAFAEHIASLVAAKTSPPIAATRNVRDAAMSKSRWDNFLDRIKVGKHRWCVARYSATMLAQQAIALHTELHRPKPL